MIGVYDSGVGGLSVFREIYKLLPEEKYIYFSDNGYCPYGYKTAKFVRERAEFVTEYLLRNGADIIVIACNTATSAAIKYLRKNYADDSNPEVRERVLALTDGRKDHIRFIGMEPAVKPAAALTKSGVIGILATSGTLSGKKYLNTRDTYGKNIEVQESVGKGFVKQVENFALDTPETEAIVRESLDPLLEAGADVIVLGCTHYPFLRPVIRRIVGPEVKIINPAPAVARQTIKILIEDGVLRDEDINRDYDITDLSTTTVKLVSTGEEESLKKMFNYVMTNLEF